MFLIYQYFHGGPGGPDIRIVDEAATVRKVARSMSSALRWLDGQQQATVAVLVGDHAEVFRIEPAARTGPGRAALSLRRHPSSRQQGAMLRRRLGKARWQRIRRDVGLRLGQPVRIR